MSSCRKFCLSLLALPLLFAAGCSSLNLHKQVILNSGDWLMAGGNPQQQNHTSTELEPPFKLVWTYNCDAGFGPSCISVADAIIFVNNLQGEVHCVDIASGGKIGQLNFLGREASTTTYVDTNRIILAYAGDDHRSLAYYDMLNGFILWRINIGYLQTSPIEVNSNIYIGSLNGREYKLSKSTGSLKWSFNTKSQIHSTSALVNDRIVFGADNGYIYCLNTDAGKEIWKYKTGGSVLSAPMIFDNKVFVGSFDGNYYCLNLDSGSVVWKTDLKTRFTGGSSLFDNNTVVFGGIDGAVYALNITDGSVIWKYTTAAVITCTPLSAGKYVFFSSHDWHVYCLNGDDGRPRWSYELDGRGKTSPVIWGKYLFVTADKYLYCFTSGQEQNP